MINSNLVVLVEEKEGWVSTERFHCKSSWVGFSNPSLYDIKKIKTVLYKFGDWIKTFKILILFQILVTLCSEMFLSFLLLEIEGYLHLIIFLQMQGSGLCKSVWHKLERGSLTFRFQGRHWPIDTGKQDHLNVLKTGCVHQLWVIRATKHWEEADTHF